MLRTTVSPLIQTNLLRNDRIVIVDQGSRYPIPTDRSQPPKRLFAADAYSAEVGHNRSFAGTARISGYRTVKVLTAISRLRARIRAMC